MHGWKSACFDGIYPYVPIAHCWTQNHNEYLRVFVSKPFYPILSLKMLGQNNKFLALSDLTTLHGGSIKIWGGVISKLFWELVAMFWHNPCLVYIYKLALAHGNYLGMLRVWNSYFLSVKTMDYQTLLCLLWVIVYWVPFLTNAVIHRKGRSISFTNAEM